MLVIAELALNVKEICFVVTNTLMINRLGRTA